MPGGMCQITMCDECDLYGGTWLGYWVDCDPDPCVYPPGACCFIEGQCVVLAEEDCLIAPGAYHWFEGDACDPNPCAATGVPETPEIPRHSWGQIKSIFR